MIWLARLFGFFAICNLITMLAGYYAKASMSTPVVSGMDLQQLAGLAAGMFLLSVVVACIFWILTHAEYVEDTQAERQQREREQHQARHYAGEQIIDVEIISEEPARPIFSQQGDWVAKWEHNQAMRGRGDYVQRRHFDKVDTDAWG